MFDFLRLTGISTLVCAAAGFSGAAWAEDEKGEAWRLFIADHSQPIVRAVDFATGNEIGKFDLDGYAALSASESGRTVFAVQGDSNVVHVISSGISLSDHGEHSDIHVSAPALLPVRLRGEKPGHVVTHGDQVAVFYDRQPSFELFAEHGLAKGEADGRAYPTMAAHHGVAVPLGSHFLVSVPDGEAVVKAGELPPRRGLRVLDRDGVQVGEVATCTGLHGEAVSARLVAFGCEEGVLVVRPGGLSGPKLEMLRYGDDLPKGKVSTLLGGRAMQFFLGNYGEDKLVLIDPDDTAKPYRLIELPTRRIDFALDPAEPKHAYALTEDGKLHLIDIIGGRIVAAATVTEPYSKDGHWRDPRPRLAVADGRIAITDPRHGLVRVVDGVSLKEERTIAVAGQPFAIIAVGGSGAVH